MKSFHTHRQQKPQSFTWATFPGPTLAPIGIYYISDFGIGGSLWYNDGTTLKPVSRITFFEETTGFIVPTLVAANAATYSQTGTTLTVTSTAHNIPATINNGKNVYLAIGTVSTGVAPTGYATGWFTNFQYVDANTFTCTATNSQSGTGAVNSNVAAITLPVSFTLPAGIMGTSGRIEAQAITNHNNSAGTKTLRKIFGGTLWSSTPGSTYLTTYVTKSIKNKGSASVQVAPPIWSHAASTSTTANTVLAINTANTVALTFGLQSSGVSDFNAIDYLTLTLFAN